MPVDIIKGIFPLKTEVKKLDNESGGCGGFLYLLEKLRRYSAQESVSALKGFTLPELARLSGMSWENMRDCVRVLEKMGIVERMGFGKHAIYSIKVGKNRLMLMP